MGLEAECPCRVGDVTAPAKVLLEAGEVILRAPFRRRFRTAELTEVAAGGEALRFRAGAERVVLELGAATAAKWARRMMTPPPSLAAKLGVGHAAPAFVIGTLDDPALADALDGHVAEAGVAAQSLAVVTDDAALARALAVHETRMGSAPIWIVHGKGRGSAFGEAAVREAMRARGYRDTKVSAVSEGLTATRFHPGAAVRGG